VAHVFFDDTVTIWAATGPTVSDLPIGNARCVK